jgi:hypothetical protein
VCIYIYIYTHTYIHTYIHINIHYAYTQGALACKELGGGLCDYSEVCVNMREPLKQLCPDQQVGV